jgi:acetyl-CoA acetyltransferase
MPDGIHDRAAIVGIAATEFGKYLGRSELSLAAEVIHKVCADAGIRPDEIDSMTRYSVEQADEENLAASLGLKDLRYFAEVRWGGGSFCGVILNAAMAIATGQASVVVAFRSRNRGKRSAWGADQQQGGRPWERLVGRLTDASMYQVPFGLAAPAQEIAMVTRRAMHERGLTSRQFGAVAVACRKHANRNPAAMMYGRPTTLEDHQHSRWIAELLRMLDCSLESDGASAVLLTSAERARDFPHPPAYLVAGEQAIGPVFIRMPGVWTWPRDEIGAAAAGRRLWARAGLGPADIDVAFFYDFFTSMVLLDLEDYGFCGYCDAGHFPEAGNLEWPDGELPMNTSGGQLSEDHNHGFNNIVEAVRQLRGASTAQVADARLAFVAAQHVGPTGALILRN